MHSLLNHDKSLAPRTKSHSYHHHDHRRGRGHGRGRGDVSIKPSLKKFLMSKYYQILEIKIKKILFKDFLLYKVNILISAQP